MTATRFTLTVCALILCAFAFTPTAHAQSTAQRTFVSTSGNDANTASLCSRTAPCRGFSAAISVVTAGGEVVALDSGGYGAVTITKSVQLVAPTGVYAAITATLGNAITINVGTFDTVVLRGLTLNGLGAQNGIDFQTGRTLHVESCVINGFSGSGIVVGRNTANDTAEVFIKDTIVRNVNSTGIYLGNTGSSSLMRASIDNCRMERNGTGLYASNNTRVIVRNSIAVNNVAGFRVNSSTSGQPAELNIESCVAANNSSNGLFASSNSGTTATMRVSNTTITNNAFGVSVAATAQILSRGNNTVEGNTNNNDFSSGTYTAK